MHYQLMSLLGQTLSVQPRKDAFDSPDSINAVRQLYDLEP